MKKLEQYLLRETTTKLFLYITIAMGQDLVQIENWTYKSIAGIVLAGLIAWKTFMSDPNGKKKEDA